MKKKKPNSKFDNKIQVFENLRTTKASDFVENCSLDSDRCI